MPYWHRWIGLQLRLAPMSMIVQWPLADGALMAMPTRRTPAIGLRQSCAEATIAPVLPALIATPASPVATI